MNARIVPAVFLRNLIQLVCDEEKLSPAHVLRSTDVSWQSLQRDQWMGTFDEQMQIYAAVADFSSTPGVGFRSPSASSFADQGLLGAMMITAPNVGEALHSLNQYIDVVGGLVSYQQIRSSANLIVRTHPKYTANPATHQLICEENLAVWKYSSLPVAGLAPYLIRIDLDYSKPKHWQMYANLFPQCEINFGARYTQAVLHKDVARFTIQTSNPIAHKQLKADCQAVLDSVSPDFVKMLVQYFYAADPAEWSTQHAATWIGTSQRTLRRRLHEADTTFQRVMDIYRYHTANRLEAEGVSPRKIATQLGYKDAYVFSRAYKRWQNKKHVTQTMYQGHFE